jgi:molybdopterin converting factor subunit 1
MITVTIQYFAILREQRGTSQERIETSARTPLELYQELSRAYPFTLPADRIRAAINGQFQESTCELREGDVVVFIPPVAGG